MSEPRFVVSREERWRLLAANMAAARFFRRELLRATGGWAVDFLRSRGAGDVLEVGSAWDVGYAPDRWTSLVDHLRSEGFSDSTLVKAGLMDWAESGDGMDRHRDRLMMVSRDDRLSPAGFVGVGPDGRAQSVTPATAIHRPSNVLLGVAEQLDLLGSGAIPVVVDDPVDAMAVTRLSRAVGEQWAGIPVCGGGLSTAQARMLRRFSVGDKVIVVLSGGEQGVKRSAGYGVDLAYFFDRVRAVEIPDGLAAAVSSSAGTTQVHEALVRARPLMTYRVAGGGLTSNRPDPDPPDVGPGFG